jgi:thioredoxin reductase
VLPLQGLHLVDTQTGAKRDLPVHGLFYGIGHRPNSKLVAGQIELDEAGYVKVGAVLGACSATLVFGLVRCQQTLPTR